MKTRTGAVVVVGLIVGVMALAELVAKPLEAAGRVPPAPASNAATTGAAATCASTADNQERVAAWKKDHCIVVCPFTMSYAQWVQCRRILTAALGGGADVNTHSGFMVCE